MSRICLFRRINYDSETGCWNWPKTSRAKFGYGHTSYRGKQIDAHRLAAILWLGMAENDQRFVLHKCDNPSCFNPKHLFLGTQADNLRDMRSKGHGPWVNHVKKVYVPKPPHDFSHCKRGHLVAGENVAFETRSNGKVRRRCLACRIIRHRKRYE